MTKGGKEEEMKAGPLFPRLHVNDADKGGPRAPPRNKMALYEQLSIPSSQRFNPAAASTLPPPHNAGTSFASVSSSQGGSHGRSVLTPIHAPPKSPAYSTEMVQPYPIDGRSLNSKGIEFTRSSRFADYMSSKAAGSVAECSTLHPRDPSIGRASSKDKFDNDDDFQVPTFAHSEIVNSKTAAHVVEKTKLTPLCANDPERNYSTALNTNQLPNSFDKPLEQSNANAKSRKRENEQVTRGTVVFKEHVEKSVSHQEINEKLAEASNSFKTASHRKVINAESATGKTFNRSTGMSTKSCDCEARNKLGCLNDTGFAVTRAALMETEPCSKGSFGNSHRGPYLTGTCYEENDDKSSRPLEPKATDKNDEDSETSMVDTISGLEISPDDVVGIIGPKQFWKARRAIVNQQRLFAVQVFELHRLVKVQKLIAASPDILLEDNRYLSGSPQKVPDKNPPTESSTKSQPQHQSVEQKDDSQKINQYKECCTEDAREPIPYHDDLNKGHHQLPMYAPYSGNLLPQVPVVPEKEQSSRCYPPANHWLVPVMSPSEGLIYKPYTGICPPATGFIAPVYPNCGPVSLSPVAGEFMNAAYGVYAAHQQQNMGVFSGAPAVTPNYFATPYHPPVNPIIPASAVEQVSLMTGPRPTGQIGQHSRSSCNMANFTSEAMSTSPWKLGTSKGSELQGSTASSPCDRVQGGGRDALPLFPIGLPREGSIQPSPSHDGDHQARVIRVVPHNARSATESAARIFLSIQKERQQY